MLIGDRIRDEREFEDFKRHFEFEHPCTLAEWRFSADKYIEERRNCFGREIYLPKEEWEEIISRDGEVIKGFSEQPTLLPLGEPHLDDCYLAIAQKLITYEEYLKGKEVSHGKETWILDR